MIDFLRVKILICIVFIAFILCGCSYSHWEDWEVEEIKSKYEYEIQDMMADHENEIDELTREIERRDDDIRSLKSQISENEEHYASSIDESTERSYWEGFEKGKENCRQYVIDELYNTYPAALYYLGWE